MNLLYSNILPLETEDDQETVVDYYENTISIADSLKIVSGYVSTQSLLKLDALVDKYSLKHICLTIGMYFFDGMPERSYRTAVKLNQKWTAKGIGEIRIVNAFKYHGKVYCFYKSSLPFSGMIGSANLGATKPEASNLRQYETAVSISEPEVLTELSTLIDKINTETCSVNIASINRMPLIREINTSLNGIQRVKPVPKANLDYYNHCKPQILFYLPLKVPKEAEKFMDDRRHFTKSNINVCYAEPRYRRKPRDWFETQLTVGADIYKMPGYPAKNMPFYIVTDDGYGFKAHTTSDNNKQFSAVGDELILGRWLKGRLAAAGIVKPVNNTAEDTSRQGMITQEMLDEYGCNRLEFRKTDQKVLDEDGTPLDIWLLSFV